MSDLFINCVFLPILFVVAAILLVIRDIRRKRAKPLSEQIQSICKDASFWIAQLQRMSDREGVDSKKAKSWVLPTMDFYRRLEALASSPNVQIEEVEKLAHEASHFMREHKIKPMAPGASASRLAVLLRKQRKALPVRKSDGEIHSGESHSQG